MLETKLKNKKAWLRIVEAFMAVLIVMSVLLVIVVRANNRSYEGEIDAMQRNILLTVYRDNTLRSQVINNDTTGVNELIKTIVPDWINYASQICNPLDLCPLNASSKVLLNKEIYANDVVITSNLTVYSERKLKIFFWRK